jgi:protein-disulfide isomerase
VANENNPLDIEDCLMKALIYSAVMASAAMTMPSLAAPAADWSKVVVATPEGGYQMGNPKAKTSIIEYGSLTCPACAAFNKTEKPKLVAKYIKSGKVKFEYRSFLLHGALDYMASMMAYCLPANRFYGWVDVIYNEAPDWTAGLFKISAEDQKTAGALKPQDGLVFLADKGGFDDFWRKKGIPKATYDKCMADPKNFAKLATVYKQGNEKFSITGTPTFIVNGKVIGNAMSFADLDMQLKKIVK